MNSTRLKAIISWSVLSLALATAACLAAADAEKPDEETVKWGLDSKGRKLEAIVLTEGALWPNLTILPNGEILAFFYNQPCHSRMPGDVECWVSKDGGQTWSKRSIAVPRGAPKENRSHKAVGFSVDGDLIVVSSGWSSPGDTDAWANLGHLLPPWVCVSQDGGHTWSIDKKSFPKAPDGRTYIPYGDIMPGADGKLRVPVYTGLYNPERDGDLPPVPQDDPLALRARTGGNWIIRGDGKTWEQTPVPISRKYRTHTRSGYNETDLLHMGDGKWLAAARYKGSSLRIEHSEDDAATWERYNQPRAAGRLSWKNRKIPGDLEQLADDTILLTRGNRGARPRLVEALFSDDGGKTWTEPYCLITSKRDDFGYPSSVQREDGLVVTAYYEGYKQPNHLGAGDYRISVVIWDPKRTRKQ